MSTLLRIYTQIWFYFWGWGSKGKSNDIQNSEKMLKTDQKGKQSEVL
jgi:hypothetical protein